MSPTTRTDLADGWVFVASEPDQYAEGGSPFSSAAPGAPTVAPGAAAAAVGESIVPPDALPIAFPGDINAELVRHGRMPDPHVADNGRRCYWVASKDWWLRRGFAFRPAEGTRTDAVAGADSGSVDLVLDGVDGIADVFLNGRRLGTTDNAFHPFRFAVADILRTDAPNEILLRFRSIEKIIGRPRHQGLGGEGWFEGRALFRKPQYNFGWDWSLPLPGVGVLGGVWLEEHAGPEILDVAIRTFCSGRIEFDFEGNAAAFDAGHRWRVTVSGHGAEVTKTASGQGYRSYTTIQVDDPHLWWPVGMGDAALYDYRVELLSDDGRVCDVRAGRLGIRESAILEEPFTEDAGDGRSFWLVVNGRRVFCKGGNWIPTELWPAAARDEQYRFYLRKSAEANFNMLRVWGGGVYEREIFYDLCDELGIMVWQDFMFASGGVPLESLRASIVREAMHQIRRLRSRPSVVLWCGCNEDVYSWSVPGDARTVDAMADMAPQESKQVAGLEINRFRDDPALYTMLLRGLVGRHGLGVPYVESSPMSLNDAGNDKRSGNSHHSCLKYALFSTPEDRPEIRGHFEQVQSFDSEFCIHGPACEATMRRFLGAAHAWPPDDVWTYHIQRGHADLPYHVQTMRLAGGIFGPIGNLRTYVKHGQALHAEMMRAEFEFARRDRPNNGGTMLWMLNDCWPTANWSIIEYGRVPKPAYYAARRACAPVLPIIFERKGRIGFFVSNDGPEAVEVEVVFGSMTLGGEVREEQRRKVTVAGVATVRVHEIERAALTGAAGRAASTGGTGSASDAPALAPDEFLFMRLVRDGVAEPTVTYFVDGWKDVPWPEEKFVLEIEESRRVDSHACGTAALGCETSETGGVAVEGFTAGGGCATLNSTSLRLCPSAEEKWETQVRVRAESYLRLFHFDVQSDGFWWADDSFFDVVPGESRVVRIRSAQPLAPGAVRGRAWRSWE